ncbi:MAG: phosphotransferase [Candidatus Dormibacteraeota bacterium]|nr:phosphotransferase [Candidatus Dormibacteraeota bacterium]
MPAAVREAVERRLGSDVVEASTQSGGFSPGVAARLRLRDGRRVFVKAVSSDPNPNSPGMHRREARIAAALPATVPTPRFLFLHDDGEWVALAFEDVDGRMPVTPWQAQELELVLSAVTRMATSLTPSPISLATIAEVDDDDFRGWRRLLTAAATGVDHLAGLDPWAQRNLEALAELEARWPQGAEGTTLLHVDLRADNMLITEDRVVVVDWPHAAIGAAWIDLMFLLPSVAMQGGPMPWELFDSHPVAKDADPERVNAVLAAIAGFFIGQSRQPPPPGLPTLRQFQRDQGLPALAWLKRRTGWK